MNRAPVLVFGLVVEQRVTFRVEADGPRLDKYLTGRLPDLSRSVVQRLIASGQVTVNGELSRASYQVRSGDLVICTVPDLVPAAPVPESIPLEIVYEDEFLLVVNKPAGMVVHPAPGHSSGTLVNAVLAYLPELAASGDERPGIVHRLDRDTSGLILVAKNRKIQRALQQQFKKRAVDKVYTALLDGHLQPAWGRIEAPIGRHPQHRQRMAVRQGGREAVTEYHVLEQFARQTGAAAGAYTLVEAEPLTGRTHQIRVHFASVGHPVVGDRVYGRRRPTLPVARQFLHARQLGFRHPKSGRRLNLEVPLPSDLNSVLSMLRST